MNNSFNISLLNKSVLNALLIIGMTLVTASCGDSGKKTAEDKPASTSDANVASSSASSQTPSANASDEEKILNIYNWSDYIAPDTIENFEKETGIKVRYDVFDSNEILHAKLIAKNTGYDIVVPSSNWAKQQLDGGLFQKLDKTKLPNWKNLDTGILKQMEGVDPGNQYLIDWMWSYNTVGINEDKVKAALGDTPMPDNAWDLIFNPTYTNKLKSCGITMLDTPTDVFQAALHYMGKPVFTASNEDYQAAFEMLMKVRPDIKKFNSGGQIEDLAGGNVCVAYGWAGDFNLARKRSIENKSEQKIVALVPKTGGLIFMDTMAIPADAKHPNNAHIFMNYVMQPKVAAAITNEVTYANPNRAATEFVDDEIKNNKSVYLSDEDLAKMVPPGVESQEAKRTLTRLYTKFKSGV
ncbi:MAG TPA: polyamine ABC transporter substrate-binding protein [Methylotenera sp.]|nr:polyamine ABC transporter substrate-binding protein [Methylotenera sp.]HPH04834.1 polyamine ABC transporter substrate-binding protein [Methylotenera sp.]HPN01716.1 polyamine ABC transporter substrate-binding protein [Methylotenera sp.]